MRQLLHYLSKKSAAISLSNSRISNGAKTSSMPIPCSRRRLHAPATPPSFGIAFDIDGVLLRGETPIGGSPRALNRLYYDSGALKVPYVFLTNGGGVPESKRAKHLSKQLGANILPLQNGIMHMRMLLSYNILAAFLISLSVPCRYENDLIVAAGKGDPAAVMSEFGFKNVISMDEYASFFENIDPLAQYKKWAEIQAISRHGTDPSSQRVQAVFIVSDPVDWSRDIQVLCDILQTGGLPGRETVHQPPLFFANGDLAYQALFPSERLGMGAFRILLESIFNRTGVFKGEGNHADYPADLVVDNVEEAVDYILSKENIS